VRLGYVFGGENNINHCYGEIVHLHVFRSLGGLLLVLERSINIELNAGKVNDTLREAA